MGKRKTTLVTKGREKKARASRTGTMPGTNSTHLMASYGPEGGKYPYHVGATIFQGADGAYYKPKNPNAEAHKQGEMYGFKKEKKADKFAHGSWKKGEAKREAMKTYRKNK